MPGGSRVTLRPWVVPLLVVTVAVVAANFLYLAGIFDPNPMYQNSGLRTAPGGQVLAGTSQIDPNTGFTAQALGHLAAEDWLGGRVPWWNPYEGVGTPLAGEMQSAALFPPVLLYTFARGQLYMHVLLELIAGYSTWFLLRRLARSRTAATAGAVAFALNGTFSWLFHAPGNPVAFAPLLLLGLEQCLEPGPGRGFRGWPVVALAVAGSLYAGFPEVAFIDGLLGALWLALRLSSLRGEQLRRGSLRAGAGTAVGLMLAAPVLASFVAYLHVGGVDKHASGYSGQWLNAGLALPATFMPYVFGPIWGWSSSNGELHRFWGFVGGYLGVSMVVLALVALPGREHRRLRMGLAAWIVLGVARSVGVPAATQLVNAVPGVSRTIFYRYADPSWALALVVLAAFGLDDLANRPRHRRVAVAAGAVGAAIAVGGVEATRVLHAVRHTSEKGLWAGSSMAWAAAVATACLALALVRSGPVRRYGLAGIVMLEAVAFFVVPELSAPRHVVLDTGPVRFLQSHLGTSRFYTLGPIPPNYGSYWGISEININDNPIPARYQSFISSSLDENANPYFFTGSRRVDPAGPSPVDELAAHLPAYEAIGVRYVIASAGTRLPASLQLTRPYADHWFAIYQLPDPAPRYSASAGCRVESASLDSARVVCRGDGTLVRREMDMPGWSASDGGRAEPVRPSPPLFQSVALHPGVNRLVFSYRPPRYTLAVLAFVLAFGLLAAAPISRAVQAPTRRASPRRYSAPSATS